MNKPAERYDVDKVLDSDNHLVRSFADLNALKQRVPEPLSRAPKVHLFLTPQAESLSMASVGFGV